MWLPHVCLFSPHYHHLLTSVPSAHNILLEIAIVLTGMTAKFVRLSVFLVFLLTHSLQRPSIIHPC